MTKYLVFTAAVTATVLIAVTIDRQSRPAVERTEAKPQTCTIFAAGRIEGATEEIELRLQLSGRVEGVTGR